MFVSLNSWRHFRDNGKYNVGFFLLILFVKNFVYLWNNVLEYWESKLIFVTRAQNAKKKKNSSGVEIQRMADNSIFLSKSIKFKAKNLFCLFFCDGIKRNVIALRNFSKIINQKQIVCNFLTSSALGQKCMLIFIWYLFKARTLWRILKLGWIIQGSLSIYKRGLPWRRFGLLISFYVKGGLWLK